MPTFFLLDDKVHIFSRVTETSENWSGESTHRYKIMSTISGSSQITQNAQEGSKAVHGPRSGAQSQRKAGCTNLPGYVHQQHWSRTGVEMRCAPTHSPRKKD